MKKFVTIILIVFLLSIICYIEFKNQIDYHICNFFHKNVFCVQRECDISLVTEDDIFQNKLNFNLLNVQNDLNNNIAKGDTRFYCNNDNVYDIDIQKHIGILKKHGCKKICTIDVIFNKKQDDLYLNIAQYIGQYNKILLIRLYDSNFTHSSNP